MSDVPTERVFGFEDRFVAPDDDTRVLANFTGEHETLTSYLGNYRKTLELKCAGLDSAGMAARSVPPSDLSLLGLVRHLADVERGWFRGLLAGEDAPRLYPEASFSGATPDDECVADAWDKWRAEVAFTDAYLAGVDDLGSRVPMPMAPQPNETVEVRDVLVHVIEEYARHMGHADFLRERIDGRVGQ
ncbi:MAG TPA: DinB family protein [Acidimicrobiales bacterium]|nr:DinB family protein [Acidimicrobiales bacterium]